MPLSIDTWDRILTLYNVKKIDERDFPPDLALLIVANL